jgi:hypothetical protein
MERTLSSLLSLPYSLLDDIHPTITSIQHPEYGAYNRSSRSVKGYPTYKFFHNGGAVKFGNDGKVYVTIVVVEENKSFVTSIR